MIIGRIKYREYRHFYPRGGTAGYSSWDPHKWCRADGHMPFESEERGARGGRSLAGANTSRSGRRPALLFWLIMSGIIAAEEGAEFQEAINQQAKPEVDHGSQVDCP